VEFVEWVRERMPPGDSYWLGPAAARSDDAIEQWVTFRLLPRQAARKLNEADALIVYGTKAKLPPGFGRVQHYAPGYGVAFRRARQ
jgi:hypothetical protein